MTTAAPASSAMVGPVRRAGPQELALLRIVAQRLVGPRPSGPGAPLEAVRWMTAVQGQDLPGALASVALRTVDARPEDVTAALNAGTIARTWPMRGTLHLVPAGDLPWMVATMAATTLTRTAARRTQLGLEASDFDRAGDVAVQALGEGGLTRAELVAQWNAAGLEAVGPRANHLLVHLAQLGTVCLGPVVGREQLVVAVESWVRQPRRLDGDEALAELATRYFRSHGPATVRDFARWTGLPAGPVRTAVALARSHLAVLDVDGVEHLMDPATPDLLTEHREQSLAVLLLPGFDELVLGYADRSVTVPPEHAERIVPGGNGMFRPTVIDAGRAVGTWRRTGRGSATRLVGEPFTEFGPRALAALDAG